MRHWPSYPWYDAQQDSLKPITLPQKPPPLPREKTPLPELSGLLHLLAWTVLAVVIAALAFLLMQTLLARRREERLPSDVVKDGDAASVEMLPFPVAAARGDLLAEARRHYEAGNYGAAIIYLFSFQLLQLDKRQIIRLSKGKTNRQYLREIGPRAVLMKLLEQTMVAFEDVFFGNRQLPRERFEIVLDAFERVRNAGIPRMKYLMNLSDLRLPPRRRLTLAVSLFILPLLASAGCDQDLDTTYGQRQGPGASLSVNGTAVLGEMFAQAGHKVSSWEVLSPRLKRRADCIVWFPDDFRPPSKKVRSWLVKWLLANAAAR